MPLFEYYCEECDYSFEKLISASDVVNYIEKYNCERCGHAALRDMSANKIGMHFSWVGYSNPSEPSKGLKDGYNFRKKKPSIRVP